MNNGQEPGRPPRFGHATYDVVGVAASAGGFHALSVVLVALPDDFPAAVLVVQHLTPDRPSMLSRILAHRTRLRVKDAEAGEALRPGIVYVARPDQHLLVEAGGIIKLDHGTAVNFVRPAADLLFCSLAAIYRERAVAVVLSGTGKDGATGVRAVAAAGGLIIAQDEGTSEFFGMPDAAIRTGCVQQVLPLGEIAAVLIHAVMQS